MTTAMLPVISQCRLKTKCKLSVDEWHTDRSSSISRLDSLSDKWRQSCSRRSISICSLRCSRTFSSRICRSSSANCAIFSLSEIAINKPGDHEWSTTTYSMLVSVGTTCTLPVWPYWKFRGRELQLVTGLSASLDHESGTLCLLLFVT